MILRYINIGNCKLYVFTDDEVGRAAALQLCKSFGYKFYPRALQIGKYISTDCYGGQLVRKDRINKDSVCTVSKELYNSLNLSEEDIQISNNKILPDKTILKEIKAGIKDSKTVFIAGRGIGSKANYECMKRLAEKYHAMSGCSRPVAMNGWESYDNCVGISGNILNANLAVCFGVSGSEAFAKGIENCKTVIAINRDKDALIFSKADYGIVDDCMNIISYLEKL